MLDWLNQRTGFRDVWRNVTAAPLPGGARWGKVLPGTIFYVFCVQAITGFVLWMYYSPSTQTAWESVYYLQYEVAGGWLLRAMHHFAGQILLALVGLYLFRQIFTGAYRAPREAVFWITLLMVLGTLGLLLTGDLLPWSQNSYAATKTRVSFLTIPLGGGQELFKLAAGGPEFGHLTLTRFVALHIGLCAGGFLLLQILHHVFARRAAGALSEKAPASSYWPDQAWRNAVVCLLVLAAALALALMHGTTGLERGIMLGSPADRANEYAAARPEWAFRGLYQFSQLFPGQYALVPIFIVPGVILFWFVLMPFIGKKQVGHYVNLGVTTILLAALAVLTSLSYFRDARDPTYQEAVAEEKALAERAVGLARAKGIPPTGALTLLRNDSWAQGRRVFKQNCATCHNAEGITAENTTAPNLSGYATRKWIAGLLDPKTVAGPDYFGYKDSPFRGSEMVSFVQDVLGELDDDEKEDLKKVVMALSAEAQLPAQNEIDARDAVAIETGRKLLVGDVGCTDCHKFHGKGTRAGPDLTGYGSKEWLTGIIGNPAAKRFYGDRNDRMPAYAETNDETENLLRNHDVEMVTDWLRGDWFRTEADQ